MSTKTAELTPEEREEFLLDLSGRGCVTAETVIRIWSYTICSRRGIPLNTYEQQGVTTELRRLAEESGHI